MPHGLAVAMRMSPHMIDKRMPSLAAAVAGIRDGSVIMIGGFGAVMEKRRARKG